MLFSTKCDILVTKFAAFQTGHNLHRYAEALPQGLDAPPAGLEAFRGGLTKIGSGDAIGLDALRTWAGVPLTTVGKPAAPAA